MRATRTAAATAGRLAVLLAAGVHPARAWVWAYSPGELAAAGALSSASGPVDVAAEMRALGRVGADRTLSQKDAGSAQSVRRVLAQRGSAGGGPGWRELAAAWVIATRSGAPLAPALRGMAGALHDGEHARRTAVAALAGPVATARLVLALPLVALLFGLALGFDTVGTLFGTPLGWACLGSGAGLMFLAWRWNRRLVRAATVDRGLPGLGCQLLVVALGGGAPASTALSLVAQTCERELVMVDLEPARDALELSVAAGVPAAGLLLAEAEEARRAAAVTAQAAAGRLGVRLMLPLGLCILPAFFALGIVPLLATVLGATLGAGVT